MGKPSRSQDPGRLIASLPGSSVLLSPGGSGAAAGALPRLRFRSFGYVLVAPSVLLLLAIVIYPMFYSLWISLHGWFLSRPADFPFVGLTNYADTLFRDEIFWIALRVTLDLVLVAVSLEFALGLGLALLLNRRDILGRRLMISLLIIPVVLTPVVTGVLWKFMLHPRLGIVNYALGSLGLGRPQWVADPHLALVSVILVDVWQWTPFMLLVLYAGLVSLPPEPLEAAQIDGAGGWALLRHVTLPLLFPIALVALLIRTIDTFKMFDIVYVLTRGGPGDATEVLSLYTYRVGLNYFYMGRAAALSWIVAILLTILGQTFLRVTRSE